MATTKKQYQWDGENKRRARAQKLSMVRFGVQAGELNPKPCALTFAGATAHLERALVRRKLVAAEDITTVQSYRKFSENHDGNAILHQLIKLRDKELSGMYIWPHEFHSFSEGYRPGKVLLPNFTGSYVTAPKWYRAPTFREEMFRFKTHPGYKFNILDIDFCGIFSESNAGDVVRLMRNEVLADQGLMFINHQKGRDCRSGNLFSFIRKYFHYCKYFDIDSISGLNLSSEDEESLWIIRYIVVPIYYICEAFDAGYELNVERLLEYRDLNGSSGLGVNMLQWYFSFRRRPSVALQESSNINAFITAFKGEREALEDNLADIVREAYPYTEALG